MPAELPCLIQTHARNIRYTTTTNVAFAHCTRSEHGDTRRPHYLLCYWCLQILGGVGVTVTDASEMQYELGRLSVKCAAIVEEIKKAVTLADPEGHNIVDWATLQALEVCMPFGVGNQHARCYACVRHSSSVAVGPV